MAGNRAIFDRAMEQSRDAARQKRWDEALKNAARALQEFPSDSDARTAVAIALLQTGKYDRALEMFEGLIASDPNSLFFLEHVAQAQERLGRTAEAAATFGRMADLHQSQRRAAGEIQALRDQLRLDPSLERQRRRLAERLEDAGVAREAFQEYLHLARFYRDANRLDEAILIVEAALKIDGNDREGRDMLIALREAAARGGGASASPASTDGKRPRTGMTGMLRSQQVAAEQLANDAARKQEAGDLPGAIAGYERALEMGFERADVLYSLGMLYQDRGDHSAAVRMLSRAVDDSEYALSAHFALGASYREMGQLPQAAQEYEHTIRLVDLETIGKAESEDVIQMYCSAAEIYEQIGDTARAATLYQTLATFLQNKRWGRDRAAEFSQRAREMNERNMLSKLRTMGTGALNTPAEPAKPARKTITDDLPAQGWGKIRPITDFLRGGVDTEEAEDTAPAPMIDTLTALESALPEVPEQTFAPATPLETIGLDVTTERWVMLSGKYYDQGLVEAALDACHEVIKHNLEYLPIHLRMGEIYERQGRPDEAIAKYQLLIDTYRVRDESTKAVAVYQRFLNLSPDSVNARIRLAELYKESNRIDEAAEQIIHIANSYFRLGQSAKALEEYRRGLQWAPRSRELHAQYGLALYKLERYEAALGEFRRALELGSAEDPIAIARLNITLATMSEQGAPIWDSLFTLLNKLKSRPQEYSAVISEYRSAMLVTDLAMLHYIAAVIMQAAGQHQSALLELEQATGILDGGPEPMLPAVLVHQAMADSHITLGHADEALDQLQKGQAVAGEFADPGVQHPFAIPKSRGELARLMAEAYAARDDLAGAERALIEARRLLPYDRAVYTKLADIYFRQGKLNEALSQLDDLATHYEERQQLDRAIELLEYALRLAPTHIKISGRLARLQLRRGILDKGVDGLVRLSQLQHKAGQLKDAVASLQEAAQVHWMLGDQAKTTQMYDRILQIAPDDIEARQWLSLMYTLAARTTDAIAEKKQIARIYAQKRDYDGAIAELHQIIGLDQRDTDAYFMLGDMLMRREEFNQAVQLYTRMLRMEGVDKERVEALLSAATRMHAQRQATQTQ